MLDKILESPNWVFLGRSNSSADMKIVPDNNERWHFATDIWPQAWEVFQAMQLDLAQLSIIFNLDDPVESYKALTKGSLPWHMTDNWKNLAILTNKQIRFTQRDGHGAGVREILYRSDGTIDTGTNETHGEMTIVSNPDGSSSHFAILLHPKGRVSYLKYRLSWFERFLQRFFGRILRK